MKTIRSKLVVVFVALIIGLVLCGMIFNVLFLEQFYIYKNKNLFIEVSQQIVQAYKIDGANIWRVLEHIDQMEGISCTITDSKLSIKYTSISQKPGTDARKLPKEVEKFVLESQKKKGYSYSIVEKQEGEIPKIVFTQPIGQGEWIVLTKPMKGISESAEIANQFYALAGMIMIGIGSFVIIIFSKRITHPIREMSHIAQNIAHLDFDQRVEIHSEDEIGILGESINEISERLSRSLEELKQDIERRKQLVRNMSHELKTPIGVIKGYTEGLKYGIADDQEKRDKYCNVIVQECNQMDSMVRQLLNLSMLEAGVFEFHPATFNVSKLIQDILERFEPQIQSKQIICQFDTPQEHIIEADYILMERVINNFVLNAIRHVEGEKLIKIDIESNTQNTKITVFNTGKPIPVQDIEHIWDVFYKVDKARTRKDGGHGLGLSIVRLIAEIHGGNSGVQNVREGVLFFIEIPKKNKKI